MKMNTVIFIIAIFAAINCNASEINKDSISNNHQYTLEDWWEDASHTAEKIDSNLIEFIVDIVNNPENINNIKKYYPQLYDDRYIDQDFIDSVSIRRKLITYLRQYFREIRKDSLKIIFTDFTKNRFLDLKKHIKSQDFILDELYGIALMKNLREGIEFDFINRNNKYYFCSMRHISFPYILEEEVALDYAVIEPLLPYAYDIINNPYKINELKKYFPDIFNHEYISSELNDSAYREHIISFILHDFEKIKENIRIFDYWSFDDESLLIYIAKGNKGLHFKFVFRNGKYNLKNIGIFARDPDENP
ncbi:hypothetical protein LLG34_04320 [bacterium]|nr:hypothetical protein [bacterium]